MLDILHHRPISIFDSLKLSQRLPLCDICIMLLYLFPLVTRNAFITIQSSREILPISVNGIVQRYFYNQKQVKQVAVCKNYKKAVL